MGLSNCTKCGKLYVKVHRDICNECYGEEEKVVEKVRRYLKDNPREDLASVAQATEVDESEILRFIREKRLVISAECKTILTCEACGAPILTGRICLTCRQDLTSLPPQKTEAPPKPASVQETRSNIFFAAHKDRSPKR